MKLFIRASGLVLSVLLISLKAGALPKASDFKEVGEESQETSQELSPEEAEKPQLGENEKILSGTVRVIRKLEMTEVFFKDLEDSYFIPSGRQYSSIYKALAESMKKGTSVGFKVNTKNRRVLSLESSPVKATTSPGGSK